MLKGDLLKISEKDFPAQEFIQDKSYFLLRYAILAPSNFNTQPWKFSIQGPVVTLHPNYDCWLKISDPDQRELFISLGCALENYLIASDYFGIQCAYRLIKDMVIIHMQGQKLPSLKKRDLLYAITQRSTYKDFFKSRAIGSEFLLKLKESLPQDVFVYFFSAEEIKNFVRRLSLEADFSRFFLYPEYKAELIRWMKGRFSMLVANFILDIALMYFHKKKKLQDPLRNAPIYGILFSEKDDMQSRIRVGQALERIYLLSHLEGLKICPFSNVLEVPQTKLKLQKFFDNCDGKVMQPFSLGYPIETAQDEPRSRFDLKQLLV